MDTTNIGGHDYGREDLGSAALVAEGAYARGPYERDATLTLNGYQACTADTAIYPGKGTPLGLIYCGLKLAGEAGEVAEKIGKAIRDDNLMGRVTCPETGHDIGHINITPDRREALAHECGDSLWYIASIARELGYDLSEIAQMNLDKLAGRKARGTLQGSGDDR